MNFPCALLALSWLDGGARRKCTIKNSQGGKKYLKPIFCFIVPRVSCPKKSVQPVFLHSLTKLAFTGVKKMLEICSDLWQNCAIKIATKCWWHLTNTRLIRQVFCFRLCLWLLFSVEGQKMSKKLVMGCSLNKLQKHLVSGIIRLCYSVSVAPHSSTYSIRGRIFCSYLNGAIEWDKMVFWSAFQEFFHHSVQELQKY